MQESGVNRKEMETLINHIIAETVGVDLQAISPEKKLQDDLGLD
jgi:acyl carrier protein